MEGYPGGPHSSSVHVDAPGCAAQGALAVRSTLYGRIAAAADRVRAMPAARRRTRVRIPCGPRRAKRLHAYGAVLACPQRIGWTLEPCKVELYGMHHVQRPLRLYGAY